jgi:uncharacterized protein YjgD (DUF1641 family)
MASENKIDNIISKLSDEKIAGLEKVLNRVDLLNSLLDRAESMQESGALDSLTSLTYAMKTLLDALHEETVSNLAAAAGSLIELGRAISREEVKERLLQLVDKMETISYSLEKLDDLKKSGALDSLIESAYLVKTMRDMLTDDSVSNLAGKISALVDLFFQSCQRH